MLCICHPGSSHGEGLQTDVENNFLFPQNPALVPGARRLCRALSQLTTGLYIRELTDVKGSLTVPVCPCFMHGLPLPLPVEVQYIFFLLTDVNSL